MTRALKVLITFAVAGVAAPFAVATAQSGPPPDSPAAEIATEINGATVEPADCADYLSGDDLEPGGDCVVIKPGADPSPLYNAGGITDEGAAAICDAMGPDFKASGNPLCADRSELPLVRRP